MSRQSSIYRSSSRRQAIQQDNFPMLDFKEISICLQSCDLIANEELISKPTSQYVKSLFDQILDQFLGVTPESLNRQIDGRDQQDKSIEEEEDEEDDIQSSLSFLLMHRILIEFMNDCGIDDFTLIDIIRPEPQRIRRILSGFINFARFREEHLVDCDELLNLSEKNLEIMRSIQQEVGKINEKTAMIELKIESSNQNNLNIDKINQHNLKIENELKNYKRKQEILTLSHTNYKNDKRALIEKLEDNNYLLIENEKSLGTLKNYLVNEPDVLKQVNLDLKQNLVNDSKQLHEDELRIKNYIISIESIQLVDQDLKGLFRILDEIINDINKQDTNLTKLNKYQELHDQHNIDLSELNRKLQQLNRQLNNNQEKIERIKNQSSEKKNNFQRNLENLHQTYATLVAERNLKDQDLEKKRAYIQVMEAKMKDLEGNFQNEYKETNIQIHKLNSHLKTYMNEVEKKLN